MMATGRMLLRWVGRVKPATPDRGRLPSPPVDDADAARGPRRDVGGHPRRPRRPRRLGSGRHPGRPVPVRPGGRRGRPRGARPGRARSALGGVGPAPPRRRDHGGDGPARRLDQRQPGHPVVRDQPLRGRRRRAACRPGGQPGLGPAVRGGARRRGDLRRCAAVARRGPPSCGESIVALSGFPSRWLGLEAVPRPRGLRPRSVRGGRRCGRRLHRLLVERPRLVGLPRWPARLPGGRRGGGRSPTGATWSPSSTTIAALRWPRPPPSCSSEMVAARRSVG